jgi:hypothetical protein
MEELEGKPTVTLFEAFEAPPFIQPEKRMLAALMYLNLRDLINRQFRQGAVEWLMDAERDENSFGSFAFVCSMLDMDIDKSRAVAERIIRSTEIIDEQNRVRGKSVRAYRPSPSWEDVLVGS